MPIQGKNHLLPLALILILSIACGSQSWGIERIGSVENVGKEQDAKVKMRRSADEEWLYKPKDKNILSDDTIHTRKAKATIRLDEDGSTWQLLQNVIARFTKQAPKCEGLRQLEHVVVVEDKRGLMTVELGGESTLGGEEGRVASEVHTENAVICVGGTTYNVLFSPQATTTAVTSLEGTVRVRNPRTPDSSWVEVRSNEHALVVGNMPPIKLKEIQDLGVLLSALSTMPVLQALGPPILVPGIPDHPIDSTPDPPWLKPLTRDVNVIVEIP